MDTTNCREKSIALTTTINEKNKKIRTAAEDLLFIDVGIILFYFFFSFFFRPPIDDTISFD